MRKILLIIVLLIAGGLLSADNSQWIRYSSISPDGNTIAFSYKGDIYLVDSEGGLAKPLTYHTAHDYSPVWSSDSKKIAFASNRYGNFDVFIINSSGGKPIRLTYHSNNEVPYSFTADGKRIIFGAVRLDTAKHRQFPARYLPEVYTVPINGGRLKQLWTIPAEYVQVRSDGKQMIYHDKKGGENNWRKHHKSSVTRDIWIYDVTKDEHRQFTKSPAEDRNPVYSENGTDIYYLSEKSGVFNIHRANITNKNIETQITHFKDNPVRFLSVSKKGKLCFTQNGDLYIKNKGKQPQKLSISFNNEDKNNDEKIITVNGKIKEFEVAPNDKEIAVIMRGEIFVTDIKGNYLKRITNTAGQERFLNFSKDGKSIIYAGERNGKWGIYTTEKVNKKELFFFASTVLKEKPLIVNKHDNYQPKISPDGKKIAYIEDRKTLKIYDLKTKQSKIILNKKELIYMSEGDQYFQWSPDSNLLLVQYSPELSNAEVVLIDINRPEKIINLTESGYNDFMPKWTMDGKRMIWLSERNGLRSYANSGVKQADVYSMFFKKDDWDKFNMSKADYELFKELNKKEEPKKKDKKKSEKKKVIKPLKFDWDGMKERKKRLTLYSSYLSDALLSKDGETLYYVARYEKNASLWSINLRTRKIKKITGVSGRGGVIKWDKEKKSIILLASGRLYKINPLKKSKKSIGINGKIIFDESAERREMFAHVWHRTKSMFYISTYHGADWDSQKINYEAKLQSISNNFEFSELLSEMLGELNVSHCGARYRGGKKDGDKTASLGIFFDYDYEGIGIKITEIIKGGPLDKSGLNIKSGMIIEEINGEKIEPNIDTAKYLNKLSGKFTALKIFVPKTKKYFNITVKPISLSSENRLLYKRWVRINERDVERLSGGKLGYVHIPGMSDGTYRSVYEKAMGKYYTKDGLIVDTRFNGGGDLVGDITMFLTGKPFITYAVEGNEVGIEPNYRWVKPSVAMFNEANYSDGHCFACAYKQLGIGKTIGMPVPGTCSYAGWEMLQNGKILWGSIPLSAKNIKGEWMENNQTYPDITVKNMPGMIDNGRDQQLEAAVKSLLETVKK